MTTRPQNPDPVGWAGLRPGIDPQPGNAARSASGTTPARHAESAPAPRPCGCRSPGHLTAAASASDRRRHRRSRGRYQRGSGAPGGGPPTGGGTVLPCPRFTGGEAAGGVDRAGRAGWLSGTQASRHRPPALHSLRSADAVSVPGPGPVLPTRGPGWAAGRVIFAMWRLPSQRRCRRDAGGGGSPARAANVALSLPALAALADQVPGTAGGNARPDVDVPGDVGVVAAGQLGLRSPSPRAAAGSGRCPGQGATAAAAPPTRHRRAVRKSPPAYPAGGCRAAWTASASAS
jgi:hypothetical protein